jgi:hypothetical protein
MLAFVGSAPILRAKSIGASDASKELRMSKQASNRAIEFTLALVVGASVGCVSVPVDGTRVPSRNGSIAFEGYGNVALAAVTLEARNPVVAGSTFSSFATSTTSGTHSAVNTLGLTLYPWNRNAIVPLAAWGAGETGFRTQVRVRSDTVNFFGLEENWAECMSLNNTAGAFRDECTTGNTVNLCTSDFLPFGSRRSPCPPRTVVGVRSSGGEDRWPLRESTQTLVPANTPTSIRWRGDAVSFLDVFDTPDMNSLTNSNVVRIFYPNARSSTNEVAFNPSAIFASMPPQLWPGATAWQGTRSIRQYDRGECSFFMGWRSALDALLNPTCGCSVGRTLNAVGQCERPGSPPTSTTCEPSPIEHATQNVALGIILVEAAQGGDVVLRPVLRVNGEDGMRFTASFSLYTTRVGIDPNEDISDGVQSGDPLRVYLGRLVLSVGLRIVPGAMRGIQAVMDADSVIDLQPNTLTNIYSLVGQTEAEIEQGLRGELAVQLPNAIQNAVPPIASALRFHRVFGRPDGIEFVLAEDRTDLFYGTINRNAPELCVRSAGGTPQTGRLVEFADPPCTRAPAFGQPACPAPAP